MEVHYFNIQCEAILKDKLFKPYAPVQPATTLCRSISLAPLVLCKQIQLQL